MADEGSQHTGALSRCPAAPRNIHVRKNVKHAAKLLTPVIIALTLLVTAPPSAAQPVTDGAAPTSNSKPHSHRVENPIHGGVGYYGDSNVAKVWKNAPVAARKFWRCVRHHESFHSGHYRARNSRSSAAGAGQWLAGTWRGVAHWVKVGGKYVARGYSTADRAPAWIQDAAFLHVWRHGGVRMWSGTHCGYGT